MNEQKRIFSLVGWGVAISCTLIVMFQNLEPEVTLYFLGKVTLPIPLGVAILAAFAIGGLGALIVNLISFLLSPKIDSNEDFEDEEEFEETPPPKPKTPTTSKSNPVDSRRYASDKYDDDDDDDNDVIDVKYIR